MQIAEFKAKLARRIEEYRRVSAMVDGAKLCEELLADAELLDAYSGAETLSLREAAKLTGYSAGHLGRLIRSGAIPNAGRPHAPRIYRRDLPPRKQLLTAVPVVERLSPRQIARRVIKR